MRDLCEYTRWESFAAKIGVYMGLFQKKEVPIVAPMYSLGHQDVRLVVGLGNTGKQYDGTRHNIGFAAVEHVAKTMEFGGWVEKKDLSAILCARLVDGQKVILAKPTTMMNLSGEAIAKIQRFYKISDENTCVTYDEIDLDLGVLRVGAGGQSAGHNGIKSAIAHTANKFWRIRIGVGPKAHSTQDSADHVLGNFSALQITALPKILNEASALLSEWLAGSQKPDTRTT
jgi:peptidyl-tRNA hydrolase, PTH1 family